jgi:3-hydroxymyristoyl/3-hydroxydecanoyl-(acyl carrier protein) dehydratase
MNFAPVDVQEFIPQREPFVMADRLIFADENTSATTLRIRKENIFAEKGFLSTAGMVEALAQTAAAGTGYFFRLRNEPVPVGYIGSVQRLEVYEWPATGQEIQMEIKLQTRVLQVSLVSGTVKMNDRLIAKADLKIFISNHS